jgi:O-phospho-L-seryl-tRNASec:L-selenocysteinyl-tRNA synthase
MHTYLKSRLLDFSTMHTSIRVLDTPHNDISMAIALPRMDAPTMVGSMLFWRWVSGTRVVSNANTLRVGDVTLKGFGGHCDDYGVDYLTVAAAVGLTRDDVDLFMQRLNNVITRVVVSTNE